MVERPMAEQPTTPDAAPGRPVPCPSGRRAIRFSAERGRAGLRAARSALLALASVMIATLADPASAGAGSPAASRAISAFDRFIAESSPVCLKDAAARCVDMAFRFADRDGDGELSLPELQEVRTTLERWVNWKGDGIPQRDRNAIAIGLVVIDAVGLDKLVASYNTDGDGKLSRKELLTDVRLDSRPLGQVLTDPKAVDRQAVAKRLGALSPVVDGMVAKSP
jgi:hypothetical protein